MRIGTMSLSGLLLASSAIPAWSQPGAPAEPSSARRYAAEAGEQAPSRGAIDLLPLLTVERVSPNGGSESAVGGYVRFWVERSEFDAGGTRDYHDERRMWISRLLIGRNRSRVLQAKVTLTNPNISASYVLAATSQTSNHTDGENFTSELGQRRFLTPYVRVDPGTTVGIEFSLSASATINADITGHVLGIIQRGARLVAPATGSLVTALNSDRLRETSNFVDQSIANLFGEKLSERSLTDFSPDQWVGPVSSRSEGSSLARVTAFFPMGNDVWTPGLNRLVGRWEIKASEPIISVFSQVPLFAPERPPTLETCAVSGNEPALSPTERQACRAFAGLAPASVLGFRVAENVTLGEALRGDAGITSAMARYRENADAEAAGLALCNLVASRAEALGLNRFDAAAAVWAFASLGDMTRAIAFKMITGTCVAGGLSRRLGLTVADPGPQPPATAPHKP